MHITSPESLPSSKYSSISYSSHIHFHVFLFLASWQFSHLYRFNQLIAVSKIQSQYLWRVSVCALTQNQQHTIQILSTAFAGRQLIIQFVRRLQSEMPETTQSEAVYIGLFAHSIFVTPAASGPISQHGQSLHQMSTKSMLSKLAVICITKYTCYALLFKQNGHQYQALSSSILFT